MLLRTFFYCFLVIFSGFATAEISQPQSGELANGLRYTLLPLHQEKNHLEIRMKVNAGAVDETDQQTGVAHLLEHLVFRATEQYPQGLMPALHQQKWVRAKNYNAVTTNDSTTYMLTPPANVGLEASLAILSQMLFQAKLSQTDLDNERKIVLEEWRTGQSVARKMNELRTASVRANSRYARHPVIGTAEAINTMPASQLQQFYRQWYVPNNMQLLIVGDFDPQQAVGFIEKKFGQYPSKPLITRDYYEPRLEQGLKINKLQDPRSGVSQVAYIFRLNDQTSRTQDNDGRYQRLIDRLALSLITQRLRNQKNQLPKGVKNIGVRKSDIGKQTIAVGLFATVGERDHQQGLRQIFQERERLKRFPITQPELDQQKQLIQAQIETAKKHSGDREFSDWVRVMVESVLNDKPYLTQPEIAALSEPLLQKISVAEVNQRIQQWLNGGDQILQYQPPRAIEIEPITEEMVKNWQNQTAFSEISPPQKPQIIEPMSLNDVVGKGKIIGEQRFNEQNVVQWQLSNGDKVLWLKTPLAKDRIYLRTQSKAGFKAMELNDWQSQFAIQLIAQNAPLDWQTEQLTRWKSLNKVNLSLKQTATQLQFSGDAPNDKASELFRLFYAYQQETEVKEGLDEAKEAIARQLNTAREEDRLRAKTVARLRFGTDELDNLPTISQLNELDEDSLNEQWAKIKQAPTTYFIATELDEGKLKVLITQYFADLPRGKRLDSREILATAGSQTARLAINLDPKDEVKMWFFTPQSWQGKDAVLVSLLQNIATQKLKLALRDQHLGVYSLKFAATLNPESQRIESELQFVSNPAMTNQLVEIAKTVLQNLPEHILEEEAKLAKIQFQQSEKYRLENIETWLNRLMLSENQFGDPRYLTEMKNLANNIEFAKLKAIAKQIYSAENQKIFITTPTTNNKEK